MKKRPMKRRKKYNTWTDNDIATIARCVSKGWTNEEIAHRLGRTAQQVASKKSHLKLTGETRRSMTPDAKAPKQYSRWTNEEHLELIRLMESGMSTEQCAKTLGRSISSITNRLHMIRSQGKQSEFYPLTGAIAKFFRRGAVS